MRATLLASAAALLALSTLPLMAQEEPAEPVAFAGGTLTVTPTPDELKILSFNGQELLRNFFINFIETATVGGRPVAFFEAGEGGNACGPELVAIWIKEGETAARADRLGDNGCSTGEPTIDPDTVRITPFVLPGETQAVRAWSPERGLYEDSTISFEPEEGSGWAQLDAAEIGHPMDLLANADIYAVAQTMLGSGLTEYARGLSVASEPEFIDERFIVGDGCVPHLCTVTDSFIAVDTKEHKLFVAQKADSKVAMVMPEKAQWPAELAARLDAFGEEPQ